MKKKMGDLTAQEMAAARIFAASTKSSDTVAAEVGMHPRTLRRRMNTPAFMAYVDSVRAENDAVLSAASKAELKKVGAAVVPRFTFGDAAERYLRIADDPKAKHADQLKAVDSLVALYGIAPSPADTAETGARLNVYRSKWMNQAKAEQVM
jgi:hypothetical protein